MDRPNGDTSFGDEIASLYDRYFVPLIFQPYAEELADRLATMPVKRVLEIAAGTGVVTRAMASRLPADVSITATDLNPSMLARAEAVGTSRPVIWRQADAMSLPFADGEFDVVVCQFGAMFFPDKGKAFAETRRVLADGGVFLFSVWDRIEDNEFTDVVETALASVFPADPPRFMSRVPHGYHDRAVIGRDLAMGGFTGALFATIAARSRAPSPRVPAIALCEGSPLRNEIEARGTMPLSEVTALAERALADRYGTGEVDGKIQAIAVTVRR
jgi:ubiquinone/menaquinone biosynthesis C-methylase UbiE